MKIKATDMMDIAKCDEKENQMYSGYYLTDESRQRLIDLIPPLYDDVIAEHITYQFPDKNFPPHANDFVVYGYAENNLVQAAAVMHPVFGKTRPDGSLWHITISVNRKSGGKPVHSNNLLSNNNPLNILSRSLDIVATPRIFRG